MINSAIKPITSSTPRQCAFDTWLGQNFSFHGLVYVLLLLLLFSCGKRTAEENEDPRTIVIERPEAPAADTTADTLREISDTSAQTPAREPAATPPPAQQESRQTSRQQPQQAADRSATEEKPTTTPPPSAPVFREGAYRLSRVAGESLPLVLDMTTECDTKLLRGDLVLRNGRFQFQSIVAEECAGQTGQQERQEAEGTYRLEDNRIYLNVQAGEVLGDAQGVVEGTTIRLLQISNEQEQQEVDWLFQLQ